MSNPFAPPTETTHFIRDRCICLHTQRAARALARRFDEAFRPFGLTNGQFSLLMSLNRPEPPTLQSVAALLAMDRTTLTAALKPLARRGLIEVKPDARDRRVRRLVLTERGGALLAASVEVWRATHGEIDALLGQTDAALLPGRLRSLSTALGQART